VTCDEIDRVVHETITDGGGYPSPLNYHCFPKSVCTSVNEVICHGIPDARALVEGDIVNVDVTAFLGGYHGDLNETFLVGTVAPHVKKLVRTAFECLHKAIDACKPGTRYRDIGDIVSTHASKNGCATGAVANPSWRVSASRERSRASPSHRLREDGGLALQIFQEPILLTPWVCFRGGLLSS
jgi:methionine aminopeptidase type I